MSRSKVECGGTVSCRDGTPPVPSRSQLLHSQAPHIPGRLLARSRLIRAPSAASPVSPRAQRPIMGQNQSSQGGGPPGQGGEKKEVGMGRHDGAGQADRALACALGGDLRALPGPSSRVASGLDGPGSPPARAPRSSACRPAARAPRRARPRAPAHRRRRVCRRRRKSTSRPHRRRGWARR